MTKSNNAFLAISRSPILWGSLASAGFYALVRSEVLSGKLIEQYFVSHPVEYVATTLFFVALAVLLLKGLDILGQYSRLAEGVLGQRCSSGDLLSDCDALLTRLDRTPAARRADYLPRRLHETLEHVRRRGSADSLDEHLKYLADLDAGRLDASYALVRVIIWAIPILGFLGTVIGITLAIANLSPGAVEDSLPQVVTGLSVAFATTTQALVLSIVLMFAQYYVDRKETALLAVVDDRAAAELEGRFEQIPSGPDGQLMATRRMTETVIQATEHLVRRQTELWKASIDESNRRSAQLATATTEQLQTVLGGALNEGLKLFARELAVAEQAAVERSRRHWEKAQQIHSQDLQAMGSLQASLTDQADVLRRAVEAAGEVVRLEDVLNHNLAALSGAKNFEQTVMSLAAAIHLLNARLAETPSDQAAVQLDPDKRTTQAA